MFCTYCGKELEGQPSFCTYCGKPLEPEQVQAETMVEPEAVTEAQVQLEVPTVVEPKKQKKQPKQRTAANTVLSVVLAVCLFITLFCSLLIVNVRSLQRESRAEELFDNVDAAGIFEQELKDWEKDKIDGFYGWLEVNYGFKITDQNINNFINHPDIKEFIAEKVAEGVESFFGDGTRLTLREDELVDLFIDNKEALEESFLCSLTSADCHYIAREMMDDDVVNLVDITAMKLEYKSVTSWVGIAFSYVTLAVLLVLSALIIFFMVRNHPWQALLGVGSVIFVYGLIFCAVAVLSITPLWEMIFTGSVLVGSLLANLVMANVLQYGLAFGMGLATIIITKIVHKRMCKK